MTSQSQSRTSPRRLATVVLTAGALLASPLAAASAHTHTVTKTATKPVTKTATKSGPISVVYMEVNNYDFATLGHYSLASNGAPVFDIGVIFAANIDYNGTSAYLYFNPQVQSVLTNAATEIAPLHAKGIKVYLSILGNHQGAGISNFPDQASAAAFAQQLANAETQYNLDGIDFDDEYADYGTNGTGQPNAWSFPYLVQALRNDAPTKGISLYFYGPATSSLSYNGINVGSLLNYSWNAIYGTWSPPAVPYMTNAQLSPAAVDIQSTSSTTASSLARRTVQNGYGAYMTYNLPTGNDSAYVSSFTQQLYGSSAVYTP